MAQNDYFICPHCDARVDNDALSCPECGSDDETGWSNQTVGIGEENSIPPHPLSVFVTRLQNRFFQPSARQNETALWENLLRKCGGDADLVEQILRNEARRAPHKARADWLQSAVDKWERDNR